MSGELLSTKYPVLMKIFLPEMNKRRKGKIYEVISGGRIVNENFIQMQPIILSTEPCSVCQPWMSTGFPGFRTLLVPIMCIPLLFPEP